MSRKKITSHALWQHLRDAVIEHLKGRAIKIALRKLLGTMTGFRAWVVKFIVSELFEHLAEPIIKLSMRKGFLLVDKASGRIKIKKMREAKEEGDESEYNDQIDDI